MNAARVRYGLKAGAKIGVVSLGCPRNLVDTETILGRLDAQGHRIVDISEADVAVVNTCAFIEDAKKESIGVILDLIELKKEGKLKKILVYGCLAQRYKDTLRAELPEVDAFIGTLSLNHEKRRYGITPRHYAYLKICEGCINSCTFCVIPRIKGKFTSIRLEDIRAKAAAFNKDKTAELNIIGQDISGFGVDVYGKPSLERALKDIIKHSPDIGWIRLLYLHPARVTDELLRIIRDNPRVCKYIDLPIQHVNDRILKLMGRGTTRASIMKLIDKIRVVLPDVSLRTSIITGFPSETDREFKELVDFIKEVRFERLGAFIYSREEGTPAYDYENQIPRKVKESRFDTIMSCQRGISQEVNGRFIGTTLTVLIDEQDKDCYLGRTQYDAPEVDGLVYVHSKRKLKPGDFVQTLITDTLEYDLVGNTVESAGGRKERGKSR